MSDHKMNLWDAGLQTTTINPDMRINELKFVTQYVRHVQATAQTSTSQGIMQTHEKTSVQLLLGHRKYNVSNVYICTHIEKVSTCMCMCANVHALLDVFVSLPSPQGCCASDPPLQRL